jgi:hypothetical protein
LCGLKERVARRAVVTTCLVHQGRAVHSRSDHQFRNQQFFMYFWQLEFHGWLHK